MLTPMAERIVEVKADLGEQARRRFRYGSGLLIGGRTVLTAAHAVAGAVAVSVRTSDKRDLAAVVDIAWVGDPARCDVAFLEVAELATGLEFLAVAVVDRQTASGRFVEDCWAVGYPALAETTDERGRSVRKSRHVGGRIAPLSNLDDGLLSMTVTAGSGDAGLPDSGIVLSESPWSGMSGAAVFAGDQLIGVVCEHARRRGASDITVTPLAFVGDPARIPGNSDAWWSRLGIVEPSALPRLPQLPGAAGRAGDEVPRAAPLRVRFNLTHVDAYFMGRDAELGVLADALAVRERVVVAGLGGVGKTQLAARYVRDHVDEFEIVAWIRAEGSPIPDLADLATALQLGIESEDATAEQRAQQVVRWLSSCPQRWLLVFDNVATDAAVRPWLPATGGGRSLITSRNRRLDALGHVVAVGVFDDQTGANYVIARAGREDPEAALALSRALGGLPLALGHAGAYCQAGTSFAEYHAMLDGLPARDLFDADPEAFAAETVATTWQVSVDAAGKRAPRAPQILAVTAYLAPDAIPTALFDALLDDPTSVADRKGLRDGLAALHGLSLADVSDTAMNVHRLLQKVVRDDADARFDDTPVDAALNALSQALPNDPTLPTWWPQYEVLLPHISAIAESSAAQRHADRVFALLNRAVAFLLHADPGQRPLVPAQDAVALGERLLGPEHPDTSTARAHLAAAYRSAGRTQEAIELLERVLADRERLVGRDDPETLTARGDLAGAYGSAGRTQEAIALEEQVLADCERLLGSEHPDTLTVRGNLATSYWSAGRSQEATELLERVLADHERLLGSEHPRTLTARANLATSYQSVGRTREAVELLERVLADRERLLGSEHAQTLSARGDLANSYRLVDRTQEAIELEERVLADSERLLGSEHPDTLRARRNLGASYELVGRTEEAIELGEQVLADSERLRGSEHPDTLQARRSLAASYGLVGRTEEAIEVEEQVLADREQVLGSEHPDTLVARGDLANSYRLVGRTQEAIELEERVLGDSERLLGSEHPHTLTARANLAASYWSFGRTEEAIELEERVLGQSERLLGREHPDTLAAEGNLAAAYWSVDRTQEAIHLQARLLADRERLLGPDHPDTRAAAQALAGWSDEVAT